MKSPVSRRAIVVAGRKTCVSLEEAFWTGVKEIAELRRTSVSKLVEEIDRNRQHSNLSSAVRLFVLDHYKNHATAQPTSRGGSAQFSATTNR